jgi:hypothetical protein
MDSVIVETKAFDADLARDAELAHLTKSAPAGAIPDTVLRSKVGFLKGRGQWGWVGVCSCGVGCTASCCTPGPPT